ncbi:MAG TPA: MvaI/BcnI family restriction endonuclease [Vicinamibacterales bacterium]|nr:MvaI/BcnI family restriction endonuclease [Vicinamibacterales bacterium]
MPVTRRRALTQLQALIGCDLNDLARHYRIATHVAGRLNKGWAGHTIERHLGAALNSRQQPDFNGWELKGVALTFDQAGAPRAKETMAITMFNPAHVIATPFAQSHLRQKLHRMLVVGWVTQPTQHASAVIVCAEPFNLAPHIESLVRADYDQLRGLLRVYGARAVSGRVGEWVQARPKGSGRGSTTRAFYARQRLIDLMLRF